MTEEDETVNAAPQASKWQAFDRMIADARAGFADMSAEALEALVEEATAAARDGSARQGQR